MHHRAADPSRQPIEQSVTDPNAQETAQESNLPSEAAGGGQERSADGWHIFLHESQQPQG